MFDILKQSENEASLRGLFLITLVNELPLSAANQYRASQATVKTSTSVLYIRMFPTHMEWSGHLQHPSNNKT